MSQHFTRALALFNRSRPDLAQRELRQALVEEPSHVEAHALLSLCLTDEEKFDEATREAHEAVLHGPEQPLGHYALAYAMKHRNRLREARTAIEEAMRLDPYDVSHFALLSGIEFAARDWTKALAAAEQGLEIDPENDGCANLRALALVQLGRRSEAGATLDKQLGNDPENAVTHANKGWMCLHSRATGKALEHFGQALCIDPTLESAHMGLVEALKARNIIYRFLLGYFLWVSRLSRKAQWTVIVGGYFGVRIISSLNRQNPELSPYLTPLIWGYGAFALLTWFGDPLFTSLLRLNRMGRLALSAQSRRTSNVFIICMLAIASMVGAYLATGDRRLVLLIIGTALLMIPLMGTMRMKAGWPRKILWLYTSALIAVWLTCIGFVIASPSEPMVERVLVPLGTAFFIGCIAFSFLANGLAMVRVKR